MNKHDILQKITTHGASYLTIGGRKRLCYLIACEQCKALHYKEEHEITRGLRRNKLFFCSETCRNNNQSTSLKMNCSNCDKQFIITPSQFAKSKTGNVFCCKSCAGTYNNRHKTYGIRRSKLERYLEEQIKTHFPNLEINCNIISIIGSELDFYFPNLKLAIQINGIFHYKPIYGNDRLNKITKLDQEKRDKCKELQIILHEIDVSMDKTFSFKIKNMRWEQIKNILDNIQT